MTILCRHVQVYTLGRLTIDGFSFERVGQFNREWIFIQLYSGFQSLVGFRILSAVFRIPKPRIPDSGSQKFLDSGIRIPLHGGIHYSWKEPKSRSPGRSPLEESQKRSGLGERDSSKSTAHHEKIPHTGNAQLHCL